MCRKKGNDNKRAFLCKRKTDCKVFPVFPRKKKHWADQRNPMLCMSPHWDLLPVMVNVAVSDPVPTMLVAEQA